MSWGRAHRGSPCLRPSRASPCLSPPRLHMPYPARLGPHLCRLPFTPEPLATSPVAQPLQEPASDGEASSGCGSSLLSTASDGGGLLLCHFPAAPLPSSPGALVPQYQLLPLQTVEWTYAAVAFWLTSAPLPPLCTPLQKQPPVSWSPPTELRPLKAPRHVMLVCTGLVPGI